MKNVIAVTGGFVKPQHGQRAEIHNFIHHRQDKYRGMTRLVSSYTSHTDRGVIEFEKQTFSG